MQRSWNRRWPKAQIVEEKHGVFLTVFILKSGANKDYYGEMAERFNAAVLKTVVGASPPGVRISLSPPIKKRGRSSSFFSFKTESGLMLVVLESEMTKGPNRRGREPTGSSNLPLSAN